MPSPLALQVALDANAAAYRRGVQAPGLGDCWDFLVLTATNEKQAAGYRQELMLRHHPVGPTGAFLPAVQKSLVVADPPGPRIGSGGATLAVLRHLLTHADARSLPSRRTLLIHSGGLSQRLPAYSPVGKIFAPLPLTRPDGQIATLFDHLYTTLAGLPDRLGPGMLVLAGDVFLLFDHRDVHRPPPGCTAITMRVDPEVAAAHGVFVAGGDGRIKRTLQKVTPQAMREAGAVDAEGKVLIDTGILFFDPAAVTALIKVATSRRLPVPLDLYEEMVGAMTGAARTQAPLAPLRRIPLNSRAVPGEFLHLGTTRQFRDAMVGENRTSPAAALFQQNLHARTPFAIPRTARVYHAVVESDAASLSAGSLVEHSLLLTPGKGSHRLGAGAVVSQVLWHSTPLELPDDTMYFQCPLKTPRGAEVVHVVAAVADDFKSPTFAGEPLAAWMKRNAVTPRDLWPASVPAEKRTLWNARLFPATARRGPCPLALALVSRRKLPTARWRASPRYSMADVLDLCDPQAIVAHREAVAAHLQARDMVDATEAGVDRPLATDLYHYATADAYREATAVLTAFGSRSPADPLHAVRQARLFWTAAQLAQRSDHPDPAARYNAPPLADQAFTRIALASELGHPPAGPRAGRRGVALAGAPGTEVLATAPVRLDLAGGWSDTPPYCYEVGGQVVNLAIDLEGAPPVRVSAKLLAEPKLVLESHDLGRRVEASSLPPEVSLSDPFALHKVALHMLGLGTPAKTGAARGLHLTTECRVPKGSGLGTSSILAGAVLAALHRATGTSPSLATIYEQTLLLEQRLSTGGGWQDQVGGLAPGVKSTVTTPGLPQKLAVETLDLPPGVLDELDQRLVVYYSGQQRLAKDILRRVVGRWLAREPSTVLTLSALKQGAGSLRAELLAGRLDRAARHVDRYWELKKLLYPGSTTPAIDLLLLQLRPHYLAAGLAGAGGGGFAYFLTASAKASRELTAQLNELSSRPGSLGTPYAAALNRRGLTVKVVRARA